MAMQASRSTEDQSSPVTRLRLEGLVKGRVSLLEQAPLFSVLHPRDLEYLAEKLYAMRYRKGEALFREGEPAERLFLIERGTVKLSISSSEGQELLIGVLCKGQIFGELAVIDRGPRAMDATAMEETSAFALDADVFWTMLENKPALARRLLELMARRLRRADQTSQDLVFFDAPTRLARKLLELAEDHGSQVGEGPSVMIGVPIKQEELAQMIGVTRTSANRLIASFAGRGWLDWNDGLPILHHLEALLRRAH
jgi:CRP/FNR family cyclic AMP-dependent transcriptional regulator